MDLPPAIVRNPPLHKRPAFRKLAGAALVIGAIYGACRVARPYMRSSMYKRIAEQQDQARVRIGDGLDDLFDAQLSSESTIVNLAIELEPSEELDARSYPPSDCATGLTAAFKDALGNEAVVFSAAGIERRGPGLQITGKLSPSGTGYQLPHRREAFPGIVLRGEVKLLERTFTVDIQPPADIEFTRFTVGFDLSGKGPSASDVNAGIMQGTCRELGYTLLAQMTTWKRPAAKRERDPLADCKRGFACRDNAEALESSDPATAAKLYAMACGHDDEAACIRFGELELPYARDGERASNLRMTLQSACWNYLAGACRMAGTVSAAPDVDKGLQEYRRAEALDYFLRACDLRDKAGCAGAAALVKDTPFAEAAPLLAGAATVETKAFGTAFALRWGQWFRTLDSGQPTLWVKQRPAKLPEGAFVRELRGDEIPKGIAPPPNHDIVYAIGLRAGREPCDRCNPSGRTKGLVPRSLNCVCAIDKAVRD